MLVRADDVGAHRDSRLEEGGHHEEAPHPELGALLPKRADAHDVDVWENVHFGAREERLEQLVQVVRRRAVALLHALLARSERVVLPRPREPVPEAPLAPIDELWRAGGAGGTQNDATDRRIRHHGPREEVERQRCAVRGVEHRNHHDSAPLTRAHRRGAMLLCLGAGQVAHRSHARRRTHHSRALGRVLGRHGHRPSRQARTREQHRCVLN
mmetsp:Transcript_7181/g.23834  ORF Transcript_7181/g.23834 Transcript_7181/m.23834 type:complete len:212 (-) Transcript_7181:405-1040(-)